ncbi:MAG TPA: bifunctional aspartate kinase/homoserine dehydrogenase I [Flavitalea sp.]|nr:bifunctional aspartate kinase/homoserine dehydrogenase I [Flavitalea sp.]
MLVLKFGGSSVATAGNIIEVIRIVHNAAQNDRILLVLSALGGVTDTLVRCAELAAKGDEQFKNLLTTVENQHLALVQQLLPLDKQSGLLSAIKKMNNELDEICTGVFLLGEVSPRAKDRIISYGELMSSLIVTEACQQRNMDVSWVDARSCIVTDSAFGNANVQFDPTFNKIIQSVNAVKNRILVFPGFIAANAEGVTTTLGRGGSDYTAALIGAAMGVQEVQIWTDVSGMMTADPRLVPHARVIPSLSYLEAMELSHFGAKVLYPPTVQPLMSKNIAVTIRNTFQPADPGTTINGKTEKRESGVRGLSSIPGIALISLEGSGMVGIPGFSKRLFGVLSDNSINVILITQGSSEHSICVGIDEKNAALARQKTDAEFSGEIIAGRVNPLELETGLSIVALVGDQMKSHPGISGKMFSALGRNGVNVRAIAQGSSERNISAVIATADVEKALNVLHEEFFETTYKQINLFIAGTGNVGGRLLAQLQQQEQYLREHLHVQIQVKGIANSKMMFFSKEGLPPGKWRDHLQKGDPMNSELFFDKIRSLNLRNTVFADVTANDKIAGAYQGLLEKSIAVVACNKVAASASYPTYRRLKDTAREFNTQFLFETNVGAGLPLIGTLNDLVRSGDTVRKMEAVLSGTLNFVFNHYNGERTFAAVVRQAQEEGYTEPDPRLDLSGTDVMRKILILARESGFPLEMEEVVNISFMPESCMTGSLDHFYNEMEKHESYFRKLLDDANANASKLKFVATCADGKASVGLRQIVPGHDLYHLYGKDNVVLFYTNRYSEQPLVVKGAGAGAEVTASGVFADILRAAR